MLTKIEIHVASMEPGQLGSWITPTKDGNKSVAIRAWSDGPNGSNYIVTTSLEELNAFIRNEAIST